jgi:hypothetical protein
MTIASNDEDGVQHAPRGPGRRWSLPITRTTPMAALLALAFLAAGCGGSNGPGVAGSGSNKAQFVAYAQCMRGHGVSDFPDPTTPPGGGVAFSIHGGPGSDLNPNNPTFKTAKQACRALLPGGQEARAPSAPKIAAEVRWARCMRSHGVPSFPDPNRQGAFDSSKFDPSSPAFQTTGKACKSMQPTGSVSAVPGRG